MNELFLEIETASKSYPDLSLIDLISYVCNNKYCTREYHYNDFEFTSCKSKWKLTNYDLLQAFKHHNRLRKYDK